MINRSYWDSAIANLKIAFWNKDLELEIEQINKTITETPSTEVDLLFEELQGGLTESERQRFEQALNYWEWLYSR